MNKTLPLFAMASTVLFTGCVPPVDPVKPDSTKPILSEVNVVVTPARTFTPSYMFNSDEAGSISYGGGCDSLTTLATVGDNTIIFNTLANGEYGSCTILVKDASNNSSNTLAVTPFTVEWMTKPLNDTGMTLCGDYAFDVSTDHNNDIDCGLSGGVDSDGDPVPAGQDALFGRDATHNDNSDGKAGFSFTKLDVNGNTLDASALNWSCVQDNVTGLIWEVKTDDAGLQDKDNTYTWYSDVNNGGRAGTANGGNTGSDTQAYVTAVNAVSLCGANDWRLPSKHELLSIVDKGRYSPAIDTDYFPNVMSLYYWSASTHAYNNSLAWVVRFSAGSVGVDDKYDTNPVRLVSVSN